MTQVSAHTRFHDDLHTELYCAISLHTLVKKAVVRVQLQERNQRGVQLALSHTLK